MDRPLADHAQRPRAPRLAAIAVPVLEVRIRAVDGIETGRARRRGDAETGIVEDIAGIIARPADLVHVDALRARIVAHAEEQRLEPRAGASDLLDVLERLDLLDQDFYADPAVELQELL